MEQLSQIFSGTGAGTGGGDSSSGGWLSKILPMFQAGSGVMGTIGNMKANSARNSVLDQQMNYTKYLQNLTPAQMTQMIAQYQKPLSNSLINNVGNTVQGQMASRGLSQAPGIFGQAMAQGLAPYELQEQQLAQDALFKKLGLPISSRPSPFGPFPQTTNTSQIWQQLMQRFMGQGGGNQVPTTSNIPSDVGSVLQNMITGGTGITGDTSGGDFPSTQPGGG